MQLTLEFVIMHATATSFNNSLNWEVIAECAFGSNMTIAIFFVGWAHGSHHVQLQPCLNPKHCCSMATQKWSFCWCHFLQQQNMHFVRVSLCNPPMKQKNELLHCQPRLQWFSLCKADDMLIFHPCHLLWNVCPLLAQDKEVWCIFCLWLQPKFKTQSETMQLKDSKFQAEKVARMQFPVGSWKAESQSSNSSQMKKPTDKWEKKNQRLPRNVPFLSSEKIEIHFPLSVRRTWNTLNPTTALVKRCLMPEKVSSSATFQKCLKSFWLIS